MARNAEVIRQWGVLLELEASRRGTIRGLSRKFGVCERTIRRDLDALQAAGFPLIDVQGEGGVYWKLTNQPFKALHDAGLSLHELCALHMSRAFVENFTGPAFSKSLKGGFDKVTAVLPPKMREFLDRLPGVLAVKPEPGRPKVPPAAEAHVELLVQAILSHRRVKMTYHSFTNRRVKTYVIEPYRLAYGQGCLYLLAFVPEYKEIRTFAVQRIRTLSPLEESFKAVADLDEKAFAKSLGISSGTPELVEITFAPSAAPYIREREWHESQKVRDNADGSIVLTMRICNDWALQAWVLSFGPFARVNRPSSLAELILAKLNLAREQYEPRMSFDRTERQFDFSAQRAIPFLDLPGSGR